MTLKFAQEERAQSGIEYILLAGGIILAAVVIISIYSGMVSSAGTSINESVGSKVSDIDSAISNVS